MATHQRADTSKNLPPLPAEARLAGTYERGPAPKPFTPKPAGRTSKNAMQRLTDSYSA